MMTDVMLLTLLLLPWREMPIASVSPVPSQRLEYFQVPELAPEERQSSFFDTGSLYRVDWDGPCFEAHLLEGGVVNRLWSDCFDSVGKFLSNPVYREGKVVFASYPGGVRLHQIDLIEREAKTLWEDPSRDLIWGIADWEPTSSVLLVAATAVHRIEPSGELFEFDQSGPQPGDAVYQTAWATSEDRLILNTNHGLRHYRLGQEDVLIPDLTQAPSRCCVLQLGSVGGQWVVLKHNLWVEVLTGLQHDPWLSLEVWDQETLALMDSLAVPSGPQWRLSPVGTAVALWAPDSRTVFLFRGDEILRLERPESLGPPERTLFGQRNDRVVWIYEGGYLEATVVSH